ncbi:MAG TPA: M6 family metalloprotease domain-containing protein, partial [Candidatus Wallbacteria bacterium]|nr:M6 family metalloprotease domain-containing protein [Candidatus Wallbacteria bacterium]
MRFNKILLIAFFFSIYFLASFLFSDAAFAVAPPLDVQKAVPPDLLPASPRGYGAMVSPAGATGRGVFYSMGDGAGVNLVDYIKTNGSVSIIVIAVEFSDVKMTPAGFAGINSMLGEMCRFFVQQSNQKLNFIAYPSPRVYKLNNTMGRYGNSDDAEALVRDAVAACDGEVDFSKYQCVMVAHAGYGDETNPSDYGTSDIWSKYWYSSGYPVSTADGVNVSGATIVPELEYEGVSPLGVICHEFGHQLGLPDLYDTSYSTEGGIGRWSLMATGAYNGVPKGSRPALLDPWCRKRLGWVEYEKLSGDYRDFNFETGRVYQIVSGAAGSAQDYFLFEKRFKDPAGYDAGLPGEGLLIYHVNAVSERENSLSPNNYSPGLIWLMCANGKDHLTASPRSKIRGLETDPYPAGDSRDFYFYSVPSSKTWSGMESGVAVR